MTSGQEVKLSRTILHVDLDAFFCSVEVLLDDSLRGIPFAVGGDPHGRGVVSSASYAARAFGVRNAMPTSQALRLCPQLIIRHGTYHRYSEYSQRVMTLLREYGPQFEQVSIDEAYLDISDLLEDSMAIALEIQARIRNEIDLPASVGIGSSKLIAKMASSCAKPMGIRVVKEDEATAFLAPMDVAQLIGIGSAMASRLRQIGIQTIGDLANTDVKKLASFIGEHAFNMVQRAKGEDGSLVHVEHEAKSISTERTYNNDVNDAEILRTSLLSMSDEVAVRLRAEGLYGKTVQLKIRWPDFTTITRQVTLPLATQLGDDIYRAVENLWLIAWRKGQRVRLIGVGVSELRPYEQQMAMFDYQKREQRLTLARTADNLRAKYGSDIIGRASLWKKAR